MVVVGDHDNCGSALAVDGAEQTQYLFPPGCVQITGRFIGQQ